MKKCKFISIGVLCGLLLLFYAPTASSAILKWSQHPRMDRWGYDFSSETQVPSAVADDFYCDDGLPIIEATWWGSYWDAGIFYSYSNSDNFGDPTPVPPNTVSSFIINFYSDIPAGGSPPWSHPGTQLYSETIPIANITESFYGQIDHADDQPGSGTDQIETVFQYHANLPIDFYQEAGNIYWISIVAVDDGESPIQWGWHESVEPFWNDNAVQKGFGDEDIWQLLPNKEMAFELYAVPIPTALLLLGSGLFCLVGFRWRKTRKA